MTYIQIFLQLKSFTHDNTHFTWQVLSKFSVLDLYPIP